MSKSDELPLLVSGFAPDRSRYQVLGVNDWMRLVHDEGADGWHIVNLARRGQFRRVRIVNDEVFEEQLAAVAVTEPQLFENDLIDA